MLAHDLAEKTKTTPNYKSREWISMKYEMELRWRLMKKIEKSFLSTVV